MSVFCTGLKVPEQALGGIGIPLELRIFIQPFTRSLDSNILFFLLAVYAVHTHVCTFKIGHPMITISILKSHEILQFLEFLAYNTPLSSHKQTYARKVSDYILIDAF